MILVDTSIWIDHLRKGHPTLVDLLLVGSVLGHPWVTGEIALGRLTDRRQVLGLLVNLPSSTVASESEVLLLIERQHLAGSGIGHVDTQLLASTCLTPDAQLWTNDKRLAEVAVRLGVAADP